MSMLTIELPESLKKRIEALALSLPLVHRAIAFDLENQPDVRAALDRNAAEMDRLAQQPRTTLTLAELRRRLEAKRREAGCFLRS